MKKILISLLALSVYSPLSLSAPKKIKSADVSKKLEKFSLSPLEERLMKAYGKKDRKAFLKLKKDILKAGGKSVPSLVKVMKSDKFPDKNRWMATFLLGRIMGKKASPFIAKFVSHPNWILRMASLKTLLALKDERFPSIYAKALRDDSFIVRKQALESVKKLKLKKLGPHVWAMLYNKKNYYSSKGKKKKKGTNLVKNAIKVVGDLKFEKAKTPLFKMIQKKKYKDIFPEMEYALSKITGEKIPKGKISFKKSFWKRVQLKHIKI